MIRRPTGLTRPATLLPYVTLFRSAVLQCLAARDLAGSRARLPARTAGRRARQEAMAGRARCRSRRGDGQALRALWPVLLFRPDLRRLRSDEPDRALGGGPQIGRAACRERGCQSV